MIRTATAKHEFIFPLNAAERFTAIQITYKQNGEIVLVKEKDDLTFTSVEADSGTVWIGALNLTQEETALFEGSGLDDVEDAPPVFIQLKALATDGQVYPSQKFRVKLLDVLNDELLEEADGT